MINIKRINERYLKNVNYDSYITAVRSGMGTGKTYHLANWLENGKNPAKNIVWTSFRRTYANDVINNKMRKLGFKNYLDEKKSKLNDENTPRLIVQAESMRFVKKKFKQLLVVDEMISFTNQLFTSPYGGYENFRFFKDIVQNAEKIILLDAYLTEDDINQFIKIFGLDQRQQITLFINEFKTGKNKPCLYGSIWKIENSIINDLKNGKNVFICNAEGVETHAGRIERIKKAVGSSLKSDDILIINSHTKNDKDQAEFIKHPTEESKKYKLITISPSITAGVSIQNEKINNIYGMFNNATIDTFTTIQMMGRARYAERFMININSFKEYDDDNDFNRFIISKNKLKKGKFKDDVNKLISDEYNKLKLTFLLTTRENKKHYFKNLMKLLRNDGLNVNFIG